METLTNTEVALSTVVLVAAAIVAWQAKKAIVKAVAYITFGMVAAYTAAGLTYQQMLGSGGKGLAGFLEQIQDLGGR